MNTKEKLGASTWEVLHSVAAGLHDPPTPLEERRVMDLISSLGELFPCEECRPGFDIAKFSPPDFSSKAAFNSWLCTWHNAINAHVGNPDFECDPQKLQQIYGLPCPSCSRGVVRMPAGEEKMRADTTSDILESEANRLPLSDPRAQRAVDSILDRMTMKYKIPKPKIRFEENVQVCPNTSCTVMSPNRPIETTQIWYNPPGKQFSARTALHEYFHYLASVLKPDQIRALLGPNFSGNPDDEQEADRFAAVELAEIMNVRVNNEGERSSNNMSPVETELVRKEELPEHIKVMKQQLAMAPGGSVFGNLAALYAWAAPYANVDAEGLNEIYTPEILGTGFETLYDVVATPLGALLLNIASYGVLGAIGIQGAVNLIDRRFLQEWAAHHITRIIRLADPATLSSVTGTARSIGKAVAQKQKPEYIFYQIMKRPETVTGGFRSAFKAVEEAFGAIAQKQQGTGEGGGPSGATEGIPESGSASGGAFN
jgi:hypothetical protein